jgi:hypothetical protein
MPGELLELLELLEPPEFAVCWFRQPLKFPLISVGAGSRSRPAMWSLEHPPMAE